MERSYCNKIADMKYKSCLQHIFSYTVSCSEMRKAIASKLLVCLCVIAFVEIFDDLQWKISESDLKVNKIKFAEWHRKKILNQYKKILSNWKHNKS